MLQGLLRRNLKHTKTANYFIQVNGDFYLKIIEQSCHSFFPGRLFGISTLATYILHNPLTHLALSTI